jgi:hypothetical protein
LDYDNHVPSKFDGTIEEVHVRYVTATYVLAVI